MRTIVVPGGASKRKLALAVPGGFVSVSAAFNTPSGVWQLFVVNPPGDDVGFQPTAAFGSPSGPEQDVTK
jgi:hypothetical protein